MPVLRKEKEMEEKEVVIRIRHLSKEYRLGVIGRGTLQRDLQSWWARKRGKPDPNQRIGRREYTSKECFYALEDVSFDVHRGACKEYGLRLRCAEEGYRKGTSVCGSDYERG